MLNRVGDYLRYDVPLLLQKQVHAAMYYSVKNPIQIAGVILLVVLAVMLWSPARTLLRGR